MIEFDKIIVIDVETTGLNLAEDRIVEIASTTLLPDGNIGGNFVTLVDPGMPIPAPAMGIHHITDEMAGNGLPLDIVNNQTSQWAGPFAAHNAAFDSAFVKTNDGQWICTYRLALHLWPEAPDYKLQTLRYWLDLDVPDLPGDLHPHRALYDAIVAAALLWRELEQVETDGYLYYGAGVNELILWANEPVLLHRCKFGKHRGEDWADVPSSYLSWILRNEDFDRDVLHTAKYWSERQ